MGKGETFCQTNLISYMDEITNMLDKSQGARDERAGLQIQNDAALKKAKKHKLGLH